MSGLWGDEFEVNNSAQDVLDKVNNPKQVKSKKMSKSLSLEDKLVLIKEEVYSTLGQHAKSTIVIYSKEELHNYIDESIKNGFIAIDTETNKSLDPLTCKLVGPCIYTKNQKQVYIPISHVDVNGNLLSNQLTTNDIREEFQRLIDNNVKCIYHNASFDNRVIQCTTSNLQVDVLKRVCGIELPIYWDTSIAAKVLNENEEAKLKVQYKLHVDSEHDVYDIEHLFGSVDYEQVPPEVFALYAATDPMMTYKLYEYQLKEFMKSENARLFELFMKVEMPLVKVVKDMELRGIEIDQEYAKRLSIKYHKEVDKYQEQIDAELEKLRPQIDAWRLTSDANVKTVKAGKAQKSKNEQLSWPINLESPTQLAILLYDVLKSPVIDKSKPRGTGDEIVAQMPFEICKLINARKHELKLVRDFVDLLPQKVNYDNRIHCSFNQYGAATGRFSSSEPNLQQIPSHAKDIRLMFKARDGYMLVGGDFSAQEPRITTHMSQDKAMLNAYKEGKDLYAVIASMSFDRPYEECLEFNPITGAKQVDGKERRSQAKAILLGLEYGRGATSIAEQIGKSKEDAQKIIDRFFKAFPSVKKWIDKVHKDVKKNGYVEDFLGRRRRLPNINLPMYEFSSNVKIDSLDNFNPFLLCEDRVDTSVDALINKYKEKLSKVRWNSQIRDVMSEAFKEGLTIRCNSNLIAEAERQSVNSIIQGGAATLTKLAMINIDNDEELNRLGFKLLITIHDEVLGECPEENADKVAKRLCQVMIDSAKPYMEVPMSVDAYIVKHWYTDEMCAELKKELESYMKNNLTREQAIDKIISEHQEFTETFIREGLE